MKSLVAKKVLTFFITAVILINPLQLGAQENTSSGGIFDETVQDLTTVVGAGAVGAVLGLSTLSFVEVPKDHLKNIAIGGAIGLVMGVAIVIFNQATKSQSSMVSNEPSSLKMNSDTLESLARIDFSKQKIAESYMKEPSLGLNFSF